MNYSDRGIFKKISAIGLTIILILGGIILLKDTLNKLSNIEKENNKNISIEVKVGKIVDSSKESVNGLLGGTIVYETAIKVDDEIIISNNKDIYYEAVDKIGKEVKVEIKNNKNINTKSILDIK
ncbi:hypothetical protein [Clostridium baratii]|uniref:hypothetical protein n=1 Tax=Clostridium baratii TaxID=1561 RepID=UPI0030D09ED4